MRSPVALTVVEQDPQRRALEVVILAIPERPQKGGKADAAEHQSHRNEKDQVAHPSTAANVAVDSSGWP